MNTLRFVLSRLQRAALLCAAALPGAALAQAAPTPVADQGYINLIDQGGFTPGKAYRTTPFLEFRQVGAPGVELSAPYVPALYTRTLAGVQVYEWARFQDRVKYASTVGLNSSLVPGAGSPEDLFLSNCVLQIPADISIAIKQGIAGVSDLTPGKPAVRVSDTSKSSDLLYDNVDLYGRNKLDGNEKLPTLTPRVPRTEYCQDAALNPLPDVPFVYLPGSRTCGFGICVQTPGYPKPVYINWSALSERMRQACDSAAKSYTTVYQKNIADSILKSIPLALSWDGLVNLHTTSTGVKSGVIMNPVIGESSFLPSAATAAQRDPRFAAYLAIPFKNVTNGFLPVDGQKLGNAGIAALEELKRSLDPGTLDEQEAHGYATLFQTWQTLDTTVDLRPTVFWAGSLLCDIFTGCIPIPLPLLAPDTLVSGPACTVPNPSSGGAGTTTLSELRYHHAYVSVPEGGALIPNLTGDPQREAPLRLPGQD